MSAVLVPVIVVGFGLILYHFSALVVVAAFIALATVAIIGRQTLPKLICRSCKLESDCEPVRFCPECGSGELKKRGDDKYFLAWPRCRGCGKELSTRKGRRRY